MRNILLTVEYDGSAFSGWQRQPGRRTVQGELEKALSLLTGGDISLEGAGRTDAGVHARGQRATFSGEFGIPTERIPLAANGILAGRGRFAAGDVRILKAEEVPLGFHARFDCVGKTYRYLIRNAAEPDIMRRRHCYDLCVPLDIDAMQEAARHLVGEQDFRAFMAAGGKEMESTVRRIYRADLWTGPAESFESEPRGEGGHQESRGEGGHQESRGGRDSRGSCGDWIYQPGCDKMIIFEVTGNGFLYNMVRIITGTLVDVGAGKINKDALPAIIGSRDRKRAGHTAPPWGLYLKEVYYHMNRLPQAGGGWPGETESLP